MREYRDRLPEGACPCISVAVCPRGRRRSLPKGRSAAYTDRRKRRNDSGSE